jgi:hypothetical protein
MFSKQEKFFFVKSITGHEPYRQNELKQSLRNLGLIHLLTPSGLHLSSLFILIKKWRILYPICLFSLFLPGLYSLKRVAIIKTFRSFLPLKVSFILSFCIDLLFGNFINSPISFSLSFLFLGIIIFIRKNLWLHFFIGQMIVSLFFEQSISILALFISPLLTFIFSCAFPWLLMSYFTSFGLGFSAWFIKKFLWIVSKSDILLIEPSFILILAFILIKRKWSLLFLYF